MSVPKNTMSSMFCVMNILFIASLGRKDRAFSANRFMERKGAQQRANRLHGNAYPPQHSEFMMEHEKETFPEQSENQEFDRMSWRVKGAEREVGRLSDEQGTAMDHVPVDQSKKKIFDDLLAKTRTVQGTLDGIWKEIALSNPAEAASDDEISDDVQELAKKLGAINLSEKEIRLIMEALATRL